MPLAVFGLTLSLGLAVVKYKCLSLSTSSNGNVKEVGPMHKTSKLGWSALFETIWSVGTGAVAGALPA
jgi:hypothetical protein